MEVEAAKLIGAGLATIALAGAGIGIGNIFASYVSAAIRNPSAAPKVFWKCFIRFCLNRSYSIICFINCISYIICILIILMLRRLILVIFITLFYNKSLLSAEGMPQFNAATFPSQLFWLVVTFVLLLCMYCIFNTS